MERQIFVNLPVKDLNKTVKFFTKLGFKFNPQFTNENVTCMIIGENSFVMLLVEKFFKTFTPGKNLTDAKKNTEVLVAISTDSRTGVDEMIKNAKAAGGKEYREAKDHDWMYSRAFEDLDGHIWEVLYADITALPEEMKNK
ncbi:MAG: glyoxalase/bleomycin resistance/extradiol dioxygenase family protein [archaeon]|nr:glyoxalase/bleomycin resistance/extradiol dioxygenase family protein [archaeon]